MFFMYVLKSAKEHKLYVGSTSNIRRRIKEHNSGLVESTKYRRPLKLVYVEGYAGEEEARRRERNLKLNARAWYQLQKRIGQSIAITVVLFFLTTRLVLGFTGPGSYSPGVGAGALGVDTSNNVSVGTSTPQANTKLLVIAPDSGSTNYAFRVLQPNQSPLFVVRNDGMIGIATDAATNYALSVGGNVTISGTFSAASYTGNVAASNVTAGVFGSGNFAFPSSLGVATTTQVGLPQSLSIYGGGYFSGNVGIGISSPSTLLEVHGNSTSSGTGSLYLGTGANISNAFSVNGRAMFGLDASRGSAVVQGLSGKGIDFNINNSTFGAGQAMVILSSGNVGIGTTNPTNLLDVGLGGTGNTYASIRINAGSGGASAAPTLLFGRNSVNKGVMGISSGNDIYITGSVANDFVMRNPQKILFSADDGTTANMVIQNNGNVGIGTTDPTTPLAGTSGLTLYNANSPGLSWSNSTNYWLVWHIGGDLRFYDSTATAGDRVTFKAGGNVGIGTTNPGAKLEVVGNVSSTGVCLSGTCQSSWSSVTQWLNGTGGIYYTGGVGIGSSAISYPLYVSTSTDALFALNRVGATYPTIFKEGTDGVLVVNNANTDTLTLKNGSVGIGTTNPGAPFEVDAAASRNLPVQIISLTGAWGGNANEDHGLLIQGPRYAVTDANTSLLYIKNADGTPLFRVNDYGNVGIGITPPLARLQVTQPVVDLWALRAETLSLAVGHSFGEVIYAGTNSSDVSFKVMDQAAGSNYLFVRGDGKVGIGTSGPATNLNVKSSSSAITGIGNSVSGASAFFEATGGVTWGLGIGYNNIGNTMQIQALDKAQTTAAALLLNPYGGNVGIGTSGAPGALLDVNGTWRLQGAAQGNINMNSNNISGVNKLTVTTVDPLYSIGGVKYATYASAVAGGVKEEYVGRGRLTASDESDTTDRTYVYVIDFEKVEQGSDLWVWYKAVDFSKDNVEVLATPYGVAVPIAYKIDGTKIIFTNDGSDKSYRIDRTNGTAGIEFSYRLVGKRFDWQKWPTRAADQNEPASLTVGQ